MTENQQHEDCFICRKHRGEIAIPGGMLYQDDLVCGCHIGSPEQIAGGTAYLGYLMVEARRHTPGLADLTDGEARATGLLVTRLSRALKACTTAVHVYAFVLGDHVPHLHIHVLPRYPGAPREYRGTETNEWSDAPRGGMAEIETLCAQIRAYLDGEHH
jgi:diadenosine tetraphosphate (Ap4A) HIT family hydrolase